MKDGDYYEAPEIEFASYDEDKIDDLKGYIVDGVEENKLPQSAKEEFVSEACLEYIKEKFSLMTATEKDKEEIIELYKKDQDR